MIFGERTCLRGIERTDIPAFLRWFNDPEVTQYLLLYGPMSQAQEERWFERQLESSDRHFAIEAHVHEPDPGRRDAKRAEAVARAPYLEAAFPQGGYLEHIGTCGLHRIDATHRAAELGIVIGEKAYWSQGFGADATCALLGFAFGALNLHRVTLHVYDFNRRAIACYTRVGFRHEGALRQGLFRHGRYHDVHIMGILSDEFFASQPHPARG
ncbi:MAG: GNAT family N-acetyltransferase [Chloroflexi bacterium]|nr:GNAT family N-acetyltransferase [Chloroflexota bacterium]